MLRRSQLGPTPEIARAVADPRNVAPVIGLMLLPMSLIGYVFAAWRVGADLDWAGDFFISQGLLSRWQVWLALGAAAQFAANYLNRFARRSGSAAS